VVNFTTNPLYPQGEKTRYASNGWTPETVSTFGDESLAPTRIPILDRPARSLIVIPTTSNIN